jgi:3-carboxy-cis,cis-muconate cycloisomerase
MTKGARNSLRAMLAGARLAPLLDSYALLRGMLRFEAALARAQADCGLVPRPAAEAIGAVCEWLAGDERARATCFELDSLIADARRAGTIAIPFVKRLTRQVEQADAQAARYVHFGSTSQDVVDTAMMIQARAAGRELDAMLRELGDSLATLADRHRGTVLAGRTLLQAALPVSFGWKVAGWLDQVARGRRELARVIDEQAVLQFGGAAGTLASFGTHAPQLTRALADGLALPAPATSWHGARDRIARIGSELAMVCGAAARIGRDVSLMMQPEVAEAFEPHEPGRGGSSAMPHKRNPVGSMLALEAAIRAPGLSAALLADLVGEHERGLGTWQHSAFVLADLFEAAGSAVEAMIEVVGGLRVDPIAMRDNLERSNGFVYAEPVTLKLAEALGKPVAAALVERISGEAIDSGRGLREALAADTQSGQLLPPAVLDQLFDPAALQSGATAMLDAVLAEWRGARRGR